MTEQPSDSDSAALSEAKPPARPGWVKVFGIIAAVIVVIVVIAALVGGHGPARHLPGGGDPGGHTPPVEHSP